MHNLPEAFIRQSKDLLGDEAVLFFDSLQRPPLISFRLNPLKYETDLTTSNRVTWAKNGYYLDTKPVFTLDPFFHAGHYYVQEASSMILEQVIRALPLQSVSSILDLCAAPGEKRRTCSTFCLQNLGFMPMRPSRVVQKFYVRMSNAGVAVMPASHVVTSIQLYVAETNIS